ncbi:HAD family hydrolase [Paenibacillus guangzhouensis]|uniref:HAD family hydrolase n=1 Tax=Paenibacillus guangzhouensis TaxID=1473112 RepID=UPI001266953B|nr:HAD family hydrolase [Paenibacillus guangzhouensis]
MTQQTTQQNIIFDLDDTLIYCNKYFYLIIEQFLDLMETWFHTYDIKTEQIKKKQIDIDLERVNRDGFVSEHFPESFVDTYRYFSVLHGRPVHPREEEQLMRLGRSVYEQPVEPYPGMFETLSHLREEGHTLSLYTGGEILIQQRKIDEMKLQDFFHDRIFIRQHKNRDALESILSEGQFDRQNTWMIGNSLRTDVAPALEAGLSVIYLKQQNEWKYNMADYTLGPESTLYTVTSLNEIPQVLDQHFQS